MAFGSRRVAAPVEMHMTHGARPFRLGGCVVLLLIAPGGALAGPPSTDGWISGPAAQAWVKWSAAMQAILDRNPAQVETAFGELLALEPSPLRIALLADHTVERSALGGAVLLFEQDKEAKSLGPNGERVAELLATGREQMYEAKDTWYFAQIGRFDVAEANLRALLSADPDPVALLELTDQDPKRRAVLVQLSDNPTLGELVRAMLGVLDRGDVLIKSDPTRIKENIERLGGPPRAYENAVERLKDSGEYAIPFLIQYLRDSARKDLLRPILLALPQIDRPALNPLVMALRMNDQATKRYVIDALGKIGYAQAVPYLLALQEDARTPAELRDDLAQALRAIGARGADTRGPAADAFYRLAEDYYADKTPLAADPRLETANVWYWRNDLLQNIEVPTAIFNEVMALRCAEEALRLNPGHKAALGLWLAAAFRREAQLPLTDVDRTRPENYPTAAYFAQAAGAEYCLKALARAVDDRDPAVALGAIEALRKTAGPATLVSDADGRLPLAEALAFPDPMVRIKAALTLAHGRPEKPFVGHQNLMPRLSEALLLHAGATNALVVDPDDASANATAAALRELNYTVVVGSALFPALQKVRTELPAIDLIFLASNLRDPTLTETLAALRSEFRFSAVPVVVVTKLADREAVRQLARQDARIGVLMENPTPVLVSKAIAEVTHSLGVQSITPDVGAALALEAAEALRLLGVTNNPVFNLAEAENALLTTLGKAGPPLRLAAAEVLGFLASGRAQEAVAKIALDPNEDVDTRVKMFAALAEAAKRRGNLLSPPLVQQLVTVAAGDPNMTLREAASAALGALSVSGEPASQIIRDQYQG